MTVAAAPSPSSAPAPTRRQVVHRDPFPFAIAAQALAIFGLVGAALGLCFVTLAVDDANIPAFVDSNVLPDAMRTSLFLGFVAGAGLGGLFVLVYLAIRRRAGVAELRRAADVILPLGVSAVLPSLFTAKPWHDKPTTFLVAMAATVLATEALMRRSLRAVPGAFQDWLVEKLDFGPRVARWLPLAVVCAGFLFYSIYISYYTILNHQRLGTSGYDLGIHVNWAYNAMRGYPARCPVLFGPDGGHFLGNHAI